MRRNLQVVLTMILLTQVCFGLSASSAAAKQNFTDEAGELIYSIDDEGIVSMFENSPGTDVTLSVTRGTREQMQPQVTEVIPETVSAGSYTVLKLMGKNLVGAKVKLSTPEIEVKTHSGKPKQVDVPVSVPLSFPPGPVTIAITTPIGSTKAEFRVTDVKLGGSGDVPRQDVVTHPGQGYGADEGVKFIPTTAPSSCPDGMVGVPGEGGGFCIDLDRTFRENFYKAEQACALNGRRLCRLSEWRGACEQTTAGRLPLKNMKGEWEWTSTYEILVDQSTFTEGAGDEVIYLLGKSDCKTPYVSKRYQAEVFQGRCCK